MPNQTESKFVGLTDGIKRLSKWVGAVLYPQGLQCIACGKELNKREEMLCARCAENLPFRTQGFCDVCGNETVDGHCTVCADEKFCFDRTYAPFAYQGAIRDLILKYKSGESWLCREFAQMLVWYWALMGGECDLVAYVPAHAKSRRQKGYDHAKQIAKYFAEYTGIPLVVALKRIKPSGDKTNDRQQRKTTVAGAFVPASDTVTGKRIVLIDDVMSTGATVNECAKILKKEGAASVAVLTVAR